ncbi:zinc finger protein 385D isoform 2-T2 [Syngnathus typhle]
METARIVWRCCHLFQSSSSRSRAWRPPGNTCHNGLVPPMARSALPSVHSALSVKHFLPFPLDNASAALNLFPGFNAMDPVQKAVLHHTLGLQPAATKKRHVSCGVCRLRFNSQNQALAHYKGTKHARKLKALDAPKSKLKGTALTKEPKADRKALMAMMSLQMWRPLRCPPRSDWQSPTKRRPTLPESYPRSRTPRR